MKTTAIISLVNGSLAMVNRVSGMVSERRALVIGVERPTHIMAMTGGGKAVTGGLLVFAVDAQRKIEIDLSSTDLSSRSII